MKFSFNPIPVCLQDSAGIIEKEDLIAKVKEVAAAGPEGEAPAGYVFDAASGYYVSAGVLCCVVEFMGRACMGSGRGWLA